MDLSATGPVVYFGWPEDCEPLGRPLAWEWVEQESRSFLGSDWSLKNFHVPVLPSCRGFSETSPHPTPRLTLSFNWYAFTGYWFSAGALVAAPAVSTKEVRLQHRSMMRELEPILEHLWSSINDIIQTLPCPSIAPWRDWPTFSQLYPHSSDRDWPVPHLSFVSHSPLISVRSTAGTSDPSQSSLKCIHAFNHSFFTQN